MSLDPTDRRILHHLQREGDVSLDVLAEEINLSRNATWRRIKQMEKAGIIAQRVALLDPEKLGLRLTVFILIRTDQHTKAWGEAFARATRGMDEIQGVYRMTGDLDYLVRAQVEDVRAYDRLYQRLIAEVAISDVSASFVMERIKETTALPVL
ncbi:Lrp/AsnC family transcriptional regulator [Oceanibium sediminis]|uniref:Lrp/AsnC family transcriptional regulator n=1 Tax=Oceanibium sediminis TaxID=2026339 RepID=UPI000DD39FFD|nr:Lrp/AsnC family transcriptional regulator [Oceanibium sediminis]